MSKPRVLHFPKRLPHTHPIDEHTVVVKGTWAFGMGDRYDPQGLVPMEVGTYALAPKNMAHFGLSKTETVNQVPGIGPFKTHRLVPIYELNAKGIFYDPSSTQPGKLTSTSPPDCFPLKLGTHVRGSYGRVLSLQPNARPVSSRSIGSKNQTGRTFGPSATN